MEEEKSSQNITLTEDSSMVAMQPSTTAVNVTGAAVGAAVFTPREWQDEPFRGERNSAA